MAIDRNMLKGIARRLSAGQEDGQPMTGGGAGLRSGASEEITSEGKITIPAPQLPDGIELGATITISATVDNITPAGAEITISGVEPMAEVNPLREEMNQEMV